MLERNAGWRLAAVGVLVAGLAFAGACEAGAPARGTVYIGAAYGTHNLYRVDFDYDGNGAITTQVSTLVTLPTAADAVIVPGGSILVAGQGSPVYKVDPRDGTYETMATSNNGNTISLDPSARTAWIGWYDTSPSEVPLAPFGDGTVHDLSGDDLSICSLAFTPSDGVFYAYGGTSANGAIGRIDLSTFTTTRLAGGVPATTIYYDRFSHSLIYAAAGLARQVDPAAPTTVLSARDDTATGENYLELKPDGHGHLFGTRWGGNGSNPNGGRLVLVDYSASGLIGDPSTIIASAPMVDGLSGGVAVDASIFIDGFDGE
jgi:hypothetical protein